MRLGTGQLGCFWLIAILAAAYFLWVAILYVGIPLALIGGGFAIHIFRKADEQRHAKHRASAREDGYLVLAGAVVLFAISLAGNIFTQDGPFGRPTAARKGPEVESAAAKAKRCNYYRAMSLEDMRSQCRSHVNKSTWSCSTAQEQASCYINCAEGIKEAAQACGVERDWSRL